jgi:hypothetical protein
LLGTSAAGKVTLRRQTVHLLFEDFLEVVSGLLSLLTFFTLAPGVRLLVVCLRLNCLLSYLLFSLFLEHFERVSDSPMLLDDAESCPDCEYDSYLGELFLYRLLRGV